MGLLIAEGTGRIIWARVEHYRDVRKKTPLVFPAACTGLGFGFDPGSRFWAEYDRDPYDCLPPGAMVHYRINEHGFRDASFLAPMPRRTLRLVALGDSFVFGEGVAEECRFPEVAARALAEDPGVAVRALNLGVSGYSTPDEAVVAAAMFPLLRPSLVVLGYCLNDPVGVDAFREFYGFDLITDREELRILDGGGYGESPFHLVRYFRWKMDRRQLTAKTEAWYHSMYEGPEAPWLRSRGHLLSIRDLAAEAGAEFVVMLLPIFHRLDGNYPFAREHRLIAAWCEEHGIAVLDAWPLLAGTETEKLIVHPKDRHPNPRAHAIMGEALAEWFRPRLEED